MFFFRFLKQKTAAGFTIIEVVVATTVLAILLSGVLGAYTALSKSVKVAREKTVVSSLANNYLEIVRNLPYSQVGTLNGNPSGTLADFSNAINQTIEGVPYKIYYEVTYIDDVADGSILAGTDTTPNDYKQVKMFILNTVTNAVVNFVTSVSPKNLEGLSNAGAISVKVINASGQPVPGASVHFENTSLNPDIVLDRQTNANGEVIEVGLPASVNGYHLVATKSGYSSDQTYPITVQNPNPTKPDSTVVNGVVTQVTLSIDVTSTLIVRVNDQSCAPLSGVNVNVTGTKLIGTTPDIPKYNQNFTSVNGLITINPLEWDVYTPTLLAGQNLTLYGTSPVQNISILPGSTGTFNMIVGPYSANSILVIVKDASTGAALEGASVHLHKGGSQPQDYYQVTGGSVWVQKDWSGGSGQSDWNQIDRYFTDDGNVDSNSAPTGMRLRKVSGNYMLSGELESSTYDTVGGTDFTTISWEPLSQDPATTVKYQVASNNDNLTWDFKGPDGTDDTYYTVPGSALFNHDNDRYVRYKIFMTTADDKKTPVITSTLVNYENNCSLPGQAIFSQLTAGNNYDIDVALAGYQPVILTGMNINGNQVLEILMSP